MLSAINSTFTWSRFNKNDRKNGKYKIHILAGPWKFCWINFLRNWIKGEGGINTVTSNRIRVPHVFFGKRIWTNIHSISMSRLVETQMKLKPFWTIWNRLLFIDNSTSVQMFMPIVVELRVGNKTTIFISWRPCTALSAKHLLFIEFRAVDKQKNLFARKMSNVNIYSHYTTWSEWCLFWTRTTVFYHNTTV